MGSTIKCIHKEASTLSELKMNRKICIVTGSRAEYGLLYWLMKEIQNDSDLTLQIAATGMHLSTEFGLTYRQIEHDGFTVFQKT